MKRLLFTSFSLLRVTFLLTACEADHKPFVYEMFSAIKFDNSISLEIKPPSGTDLSYNSLPLLITNKTDKLLTIEEEKDIKIYSLSSDKKDLKEIDFQVVKIGKPSQFPVHIQKDSYAKVFLLPVINPNNSDANLLVTVMATEEGNSKPTIGAVSEIHANKSIGSLDWISIYKYLPKFQSYASKWDKGAYLSSVNIISPNDKEYFNIMFQFIFQSLAKGQDQFIVSITDQGIISTSGDIVVGLPDRRRSPIQMSEWSLDAKTVIYLLMSFDNTIKWPANSDQELILQHDQTTGDLQWLFYKPYNDNLICVVNSLNGDINFP